MAQLLSKLKQRFFDANGDPLAGGKLYSYEAGTATPLDTYTDQGGGTANANPVILDSNGEGDVWVGASAHKFVLKDSSDVTQFTIDNVSDVADSSITTAKINDLAVTTGKLANNAVTAAKMETLNRQTSSSSGNYFGSPTSSTPVTNLTRSITTRGRPVLIFVQPDGGTTGCDFGAASSDGDIDFKIRYFRGATEIAVFNYTAGLSGSGASGSAFVMPFNLCFLDDAPAAGTYTYTVEVQSTVDTVFVRYLKLIAVEL